MILEIFFWEDENNWLLKLWFYKTSEAPTNQNSMIFFEYVDSMAIFFFTFVPTVWKLHHPFCHSIDVYTEMPHPKICGGPVVIGRSLSASLGPTRVKWFPTFQWGTCPPVPHLKCLCTLQMFTGTNLWKYLCYSNYL